MSLPNGCLLPQRGSGSLEDYVSSLVRALDEALSDLFQPGALSSIQITSSQVSGTQAHSTLLDAIAALTSNGLIARTGSGAASARTITGGTGVTVTNGDGVAGNPTISVSGGGVTTFNTRTGDVVLLGSDVAAAVPFDLLLSQQVI